MTHHLLPRRLLESANSSANEGALQAEGAVNSDFILILAALLCALICVLGLIAVARCACFRRRFSSSSSGGPQYHPRYNKGLKKAALRSLPKLTFSDELTPKLATAECPICLSEFVSGDEIRILPQCGHTFHLSCIDTWLGSHSSCPSCRQILAVPRRCQRCGGLPLEQEVSTNDDTADRGREGDNTFLP